jgi:kynureninase
VGQRPRDALQNGPEFVPVQSADAWQLSNPPILSLAPVKASLDLFDRATMPAIREKSLRLTGYLESLLTSWCRARVKLLTPADPAQRGAQLSLVIPGVSRDIERRLHDADAVVDFREPDVIRAAPTALYNSFQDVHRFASILRRTLDV